ncbi:MAG: undecaprenyl-diphosphate phosphatase [Candidatus Bathyarchaeota archaeon]|nr:MAG: undecaprenyl-diphosphate phosphatase [Candidatus Bathyarchaeota archaeon]
MSYHRVKRPCADRSGSGRFAVAVFGKINMVNLIYWRFMVSFAETLLLGVLQGVTEWLPVSSSGHLALAKEFLDWQPPLVFYILLHLGTLIVTLAFFRRDVVMISKALLRGDFRSREGRVGIFILLGSIPTAIIGLFFRELFESFFDNTIVIGLALLITGVLLFVSKRIEGKRSLNVLDTAILGAAQGFAIIPGISRSGVTISAGLLRRLERESVFKFSFLLSIPSILGALVVESDDLGLLVTNGDLPSAALGLLASVIVGYLSLKALRIVVLKRKFHLFAFYCWIAGTLTVAFSLS